MMNACLLIFCWLHWWFSVNYTDDFLLITLIYTNEEQQIKHILTMHEVSKDIWNKKDSLEKNLCSS